MLNMGLSNQLPRKYLVIFINYLFIPSVLYSAYTCLIPNEYLLTLLLKDTSQRIEN